MNGSDHEKESEERSAPAELDDRGLRKIGSRPLSEVLADLDALSLSDCETELRFVPELIDVVSRYAKTVAAHMTSPERSLGWVVAITDSGVSLLDLAKELARILYGSTENVFYVNACLSGATDVMDALLGSPPGFEKPDEPTLEDFLVKHPASMVLFEDFQAFEPRLIELFAATYDEGVFNTASSLPVSTEQTIFITTARVGVPSPDELDLIADQPLTNQSIFSYTVGAALARSQSEHFSGWVRGRFDRFLVNDLWARYQIQHESGDQALPLVEIDESAIQIHSPPATPFGPHQIVDDVDAALPQEIPPIKYDVFISYRTKRDAEAAKLVAGELEKQGRTRFVDWEVLDVPASDSSMEQLIREIVLAVRASRCTIAFAAGLETVRLPAGMSKGEALKRGIAMREPLRGAMVKWNWQELELRECRDLVLVIDRTTGKAYVTRNRALVSPYLPFENQEEMLQIVRDFLEERFAEGESES